MSAAAHETVVEPGLVVFLSNFNHGRFLAEALDALLAQSVRPGSIHVVDDASTDDSRVVIESYARRFPDTVRAVFLGQNRGFVANVTDWLAGNNSEFVLIAAADDRVGSALVEKSLALLRRFPEAGLCSACARLLDEGGHDLGPFHSHRPLAAPGYIPPTQVRHLLMSEEGWFMGNTTVFRGAALRAVGFDRQLGAFADGFASRAIALRQGACFIPEELGFWRRMGGGMAAQATTVPAVVHAVAARAIDLMEGPYAPIFPAGYSRRWRRRWLYWAVTAGYALPRSEIRPYLREVLAPLAIADRQALQAFAALPRRLAPLAAFVWLRPFDVISVVKRYVDRST